MAECSRCGEYHLGRCPPRIAGGGGWVWTVVVVLLLGQCAAIGCDGAQSAKRASRGKDHRVILWSGGKPVREWRSAGHVNKEGTSSLIYFKDRKTGGFVRLRGTISIETLPRGE